MARQADRDLACGNHHGQRLSRANRPNTRLHPTTTPKRTLRLAMREPSTQDVPNVRHGSGAVIPTSSAREPWRSTNVRACSRASAGIRPGLSAGAGRGRRAAFEHRSGTSPRGSGPRTGDCRRLPAARPPRGILRRGPAFRSPLGLPAMAPAAVAMDRPGSSQVPPRPSLSRRSELAQAISTALSGTRFLRPAVQARGPS